MRHPEQAKAWSRKSNKRITLGLVRQALRNERFELPAELLAMEIPTYTAKQIAEGRSRSLEKAARRVEKRRQAARYSGVTKP